MESLAFDWSALLSTIRDSEKSKFAAAKNSPLGIKFIDQNQNNVLQLYLESSTQVEFNIVKNILDAGGVNPKHKNCFFNSALMIAAQNNTTTFKTFDLLIQSGGVLSKRNQKRQNVLMIYVKSKMNDEKAQIDPSIVKLMIKKGANFQEESLIRFAIRELNFVKRETVLQAVLYQGKKIHELDSDFKYYLSTQRIQFETAEMFLKAGAIKGSCFNAILENKNLKIDEIKQWVKFLAQKGAQINQFKILETDELKQIESVWKNVEEVRQKIEQYKEKVSIFIEYGFNQNILKKNHQEFLLEYLCYGKKNEIICEVIDYFLNSGVDINCTDSEGKNMLFKYLECIHANEFVIKFLIDAGTNLNQTCNQGNNPLLHYLSNQKTDKLSKKIFDTILNAGIYDINAVNYCKENLLHIYLKRFSHQKQINEEDLQYLIKKGCNVNQTDANDQNPLQTYLKSNRLQNQSYSYDYQSYIIRTLIDAGTNLNNFTHSTLSAFQVLINEDCDHIISVAKRMMIQAGADVNQVIYKDDFPQSYQIPRTYSLAPQQKEKIVHALSNCYFNFYQNEFFDYQYVRLVLLAGFDLKLLTKQQFQDLSGKHSLLYQAELEVREMIGNIPFQDATDPTMEKSFLKFCLLENELPMLKLMHHRAQIDKKHALAKIPAGVFREITRYV